MGNFNFPKIYENRESKIIVFNNMIYNINNQEYNSKEIEIIIDYDSYNDPCGIEIINLKHNLGKNSLSGNYWEKLRYSYDDESDAFYVYLKEFSNSIDQIATIAKAILDSDNSMFAIEINNDDGL